MDSASPAEPSRVGNIHGISLHIESEDERSSQVLTFDKSQSSAITIGRRSSHTRRSGSLRELDCALFRCPVVSRKHAKITFTKYGNAYITDLKSHHGTYILRPGDTLSKPIKAETPTVLADGDIVTFGKIVSNDDTIVHPITARVSLLYGPGPAAATLTHITPNANEAGLSEEPPRGTSGRYGIYVSSDESEESSDGGSDVEEIPPPSPPAAARMHRCNLPTFTRPSDCSARMQLLRQVLPAIQPACIVDLRSVSPDPAPPALPPLESASPALVPTLVQQDGQPGGEAARDDGPNPELSIVDRRDLLRDLPDLSVPPPMYSFPWPLAFSFDVNAGACSHAIEGTDFMHDCDSELANASESPATQVSENVSGGQAQDGEEDDTASSEGRSTTPEEQPTMVLTELEAQVNLASNDISTLQIQRRSDESRFEEHVRATKARLAELDEHMQELNGRVTKHVAANDVIMAEATSRVDDLRADINLLHTELTDKLASEERASANHAVELNNVDAMRTMMEDMRSLKNAVETQLARDIEIIKVAHAQTQAALQALTAASAQQAETSGTRKRKRLETDNTEADNETGGESRVAAPLPKRRRTAGRFVKQVVQTTTVAAVGAVFAVAALAFV